MPQLAGENPVETLRKEEEEGGEGRRAGLWAEKKEKGNREERERADKPSKEKRERKMGKKEEREGRMGK